MFLCLSSVRNYRPGCTTSTSGNNEHHVCRKCHEETYPRRITETAFSVRTNPEILCESFCSFDCGVYGVWSVFIRESFYTGCKTNHPANCRFIRSLDSQGRNRRMVEFFECTSPEVSDDTCSEWETAALGLWVMVDNNDSCHRKDCREANTSCESAQIMRCGAGVSIELLCHAISGCTYEFPPACHGIRAQYR